MASRDNLVPDLKMLHKTTPEIRVEPGACMTKRREKIGSEAP